MDNYSSRKLELLALTWAITEKFRDYLLGSKFTVFTDNNPLCYLQTSKLSAHEQRWLSKLAVFNFEIDRKVKDLQERDTVVGKFIEIWNTKRKPLRSEQRKFDRPLVTLLRQWDRIEVVDGLVL
ncbi:Hypothetical predicted protein [Mytilus galloprovincialis]|uniref:Reverse transcriptase RNase H-like domain-containing protein n=1 Tax=Mytilus galloprovincialis TaxID=29158 RepID=A0A8B6FX94_MYTGA|nr:Hypothetical predicted protein [Mytilus galloprovincialis]